MEPEVGEAILNAGEIVCTIESKVCDLSDEVDDIEDTVRQSAACCTTVISKLDALDDAIDNATFVDQCCQTISSQLDVIDDKVNNVDFIHNNSALWETKQELSLKFIREIGETESNVEGLMFFRPNDIEIDNADFIYVADGGNYTVKKFTKDLKSMI